MWHWDQGRLDYFQFDNLKKIARFALSNDLVLADRKKMADDIGLPFLPDSDQYPPWRNYSRVFGLSLICAKKRMKAQPTKIAQALAGDGVTTTDEYFHFLCVASTDPSPALRGWNSAAVRRYPLLFSLKVLLARAVLGENTTSISQIVGSYVATDLIGNENLDEFVELVKADHKITNSGCRQAAESLQVIAQISYLSLEKRNVTVSLSEEDAINIFCQLEPIPGTPQADPAEEVFRITDLFDAAVDKLELDYAATMVSDVEESGFSSSTTFKEGTKTRKTHLIMERNGKLRTKFFKAYPSAVCDFCATDTSEAYPWTKRILDIHHLLPLCSGARTSKSGTMLDDLVAVCPTCHRGIHRYYDTWLMHMGRKDFLDANQAKMVYAEAKKQYRSLN